MPAYFKSATAAAWCQTALVLVGLIVAIGELREGRHSNSVTQAIVFIREFYAHDSKLYRFVGEYSIRQFETVQRAKKHIKNYDPKNDEGFEKLFTVARPMIAAEVAHDIEDLHKIMGVAKFFDTAADCALTAACNSDIIVRELAEEMQRFYNSVCPYLEELSAKWGQESMQPTVYFLYYRAGIRDKKNYLCKGQVTSLENANLVTQLYRRLAY